MSQLEKRYEPSQYAATPAHGMTTEFKPGTQTLAPGYQLAPMFLPLSSEIVFEKDVAVTLRDGVTIYVDVFRPAGTEQVPVIVAWSPYGKSHGSSPMVLGLLGMLGLDNSARSGLEKFEGPDPAYWCAKGYAVCNPDPRGIAHSEGDSAMFGRQEGQDCHDLIEWLAEQEWSNGKVGMSGTSYLAVAQWFTAAEQPPHLAAINPWEGFSDIYRDLVMRGGMPDIGFGERLQKQSYMGQNQREDILSEVEEHPLVDDLWEDKTPRFEQVTVPGVRRGQLLQHPAHGRHVPRLATDRLDRQVAARPQHAGVARLLPRGERRGPAPLLRPLPQGRGQRLGADRTGPLQPPRPRGRRQRGPRGHGVPAHRRDAR